MDEVARIRERIDLAGLISEFIPLRKMGRNFKAVCPFHNEKTPSFVVSPERQIWHCFGCSKGGDCFTFLMERESLEFVEALRILAKKTGVELKSSGFQTGVSAKKEKIYVLNKIAMGFYHYVLISHAAGKQALIYLLDERKIEKPLTEIFMLGFAPKSGVSLSDYLLNKKKYKKEDLIDAGLAYQRGNQIFDFFKNRLMFPLFDHRNNVVGFSGRAIDKDFFGGKYINSRETQVYHKGSMFFGLNMAKDEIKKQDRAILVEGEFDVIAFYSQGIKNAVAVKGTALTEDQVNLLSRFTQNITLCFDQDMAGYEAAKRSLPILEKKGFSISAIVFTNGKDADEAIKNDHFLFKKAVKNTGSIYDYIFNRIFGVYDKNTVEGKRKIASELLPIIYNIQNEIIKEHFLKKLSLDLDTSYESLVRELEKAAKAQAINKPIVFEKKDKRERLEILEEYLLALIVQNENPKVSLKISQKTFEDYVFATPAFPKIIKNLNLYFENKSEFNIKQFLSFIPQELAQAFDTCFLLPLPKFIEKAKEKEEIEKVSRELRAIFLKNKIKVLSKSLKNEEKEENGKEIENLEKELVYLIKLLPKS